VKTSRIGFEFFQEMTANDADVGWTSIYKPEWM
jgi:hypothetical protein